MPGVTALEGVSCPSVSFCAAADHYDSSILTSDRPTAGAGVWVATHVGPGNSLLAVSCPTLSFCAAADGGGFVLSSDDPAGRADKWAATTQASGILDGISCPTRSLCVGIGIDGNIVARTNPRRAAAWVGVAKLPLAGFSFGPGTPHETAVSCTSRSLCVAVGYPSCLIGSCGDQFAPNYLASSTDPTGGPSKWKVITVPQAAALESVSCPSRTLCVATAGDEIVTSTDPTGGAGAWSVIHVGGSLPCPA
jgi:hypothetical protein